jgi:hypothetical protein
MWTGGIVEKNAMGSWSGVVERSEDESSILKPSVTDCDSTSRKGGVSSPSSFLSVMLHSIFHLQSLSA